MNFKKFFDLAAEKGISESQIFVSRSASTSITLFHHEIDAYHINSAQSVVAIGIYNGKLGSGATEKLGPDTFEFLVNQIILTATYSEKPNEIGLFKGVDKYASRKTFDKTLALVPIEKKIADLRELENEIYAFDKRITDADHVTYSERESSQDFYNSYGLKLSRKSNYYYFLAGAVARDKDETKTFYEIHFDTDYSTFKPKELAKKACEKALKKFGGKPCKAGKYPTVLHKDIMGSLLGYFMHSCVADEVQRHSSFLEGKLHTKVASSKLTIEEKPLAKSFYFRGFDDEGVPCKNKFIVRKGVLENYFYNRETAHKDGVESTGNGSWGGSKFVTDVGPLYVKGTKKTFEQMIAPIKKGIYITEIAGLGTGMNANSGDFSCQAEGYMIEDGKVTTPLNLITLSGNLFKMLNDIRDLDNEAKMDESGMAVPAVYIKSMNIGGE